MGLWSLSHTHSHIHTHTHTHTHGRWDCGFCHTHTHTHRHTHTGRMGMWSLSHSHPLTQREDGAAVPISRHRASRLPWLRKRGEPGLHGWGLSTCLSAEPSKSRGAASHNPRASPAMTGAGKENTR